MNDVIECAFKNFRVPVNFLYYDGKETTYIIYQLAWSGNIYDSDGKISWYVDYYDFFGYLAMGAPEDEYDIETREIRKKINRYSSEKEIRRAVVNTFIEKFDADLSTDMFADSLEQMVRDIKSDLDEL